MPKKIFFIFLATLLSAVFVADTAGAKKPSDYVKGEVEEHDTVWYESTVEHEGQAPMKIEYYKDKEKESFVIKTKQNGNYKKQSVLIKDENMAYLLIPSQQMALKMPKDSPMVQRYFTYKTLFDQFKVQWPNFVQLHLVENEKKVTIKEKGRKKIRDVNCRRFEIKDERNQSESTVYVSKDNIIRKWKYKGGAPAETKVVYDVLKVSFDESIPGKKFEVPKEYQLRDMEQMQEQPR